jgi:hypothetical protein
VDEDDLAARAHVVAPPPALRMASSTAACSER